MGALSRRHLALFALLGLCLGLAAAPAGKTAAGHGPDTPAAGRELFTREWLPGDPRSYAGDGLGPVHNARSCVACHQQAGPGGAGPRQVNAMVVSAFVQADFRGPISGMRLQEPDPKKPLQQPDRSKLAEIHPALRTEGSFPLHRFGTDPEFLRWKASLFGNNDSPATDGATVLNAQATASMMGLAGGERKVGDANIALIGSQRNTPALFGSGLMDRIPNHVLEAVAAEQAKGAAAAAKAPAKRADASTFGEGPFGGIQTPLPVAGRVARLKDGRAGRFGWKAHVATLREFTLQACSNELGLEVPGFPRAAPAWKKGYRAPGLDLSAEQCDELTRFVAGLPAPGRRPPETPQHAAEIAAGERLFGAVGCTVCHRPKLGDVDGIYSDLLLHDMGQFLSDTGSYGVLSTPEADPGATVDPLPVNNGFERTATPEKRPKFGAAAREWRTPPLWGLRDSAPYLHDGRADTVADAVALHGGEGLAAAQAFFGLTPRERLQVELFLLSLAAPDH